MIGAFYRLLNIVVKLISDREHSLRFATFAYMRYFFVTNRENQEMYYLAIYYVLFIGQFGYLSQLLSFLLRDQKKRNQRKVIGCV